MSSPNATLCGERREEEEEERKISGTLQSFSVPNSFLPALLVRSRRDPGKFLHYPSFSHAPGSYTRRILTSKQHQKSPFVAISAEKRATESRGGKKKLRVFALPPTSKKLLDVCNRIPGSDAPPPFPFLRSSPPFYGCIKTK